MGRDMEILWLTSWENLTEERFARTMRSLARLPLTEVYLYEPEHPDAPLFSTVDLDLGGQMIQGLHMDFYASSGPGVSYYGAPIPEGIGCLIGNWNKRMVQYEEPFDEMLTYTIAMIAEGIDAQYATYTDELGMDDVRTFEDLWKLGSAYNFFSWPLVDVIGREEMSKLGQTVEVSNGLAIFYNTWEARDLLHSLMDRMWDELKVSCGGYADKHSEYPKTVEGPQKIDNQYKSTPGLVEPLPDERWMYFVCFYPLENHDRDRYTYFINDVGTIELSTPRAARAWWHNNDDFVDTIMEEHRSNLMITIPHFKHRFSHWSRRPVIGHNWFSVELISGLPDGPKSEALLERPGMVTAVFKCSMSRDVTDTQVFLLNALSCFAPHLEPSFGFWITDNDWFMRNKRDLDNPERLLWPITLYGPDDLLEERRKVLSGLAVENHGEIDQRWSVLSPRPHILLLANSRYDKNDGFELTDPDSLGLRDRLNAVLDGRRK